MNLLDRLRNRTPDDSQERAGALTFDQLGFLYGGHQYPMLNTTWGSHGDTEGPVKSFDDFAMQVLKANPVVFSASAIRMSVFAQARLVKQRRSNGKVVDTFTDQSLAKFQRPWPGGTTFDLLSRMLLHVDVAGNAFVRDGDGDRLHMMRPDRVTIVLGSQLDEENPANAEDVEVAGYMYTPDGGRGRFYTPGEVAHFTEMPDPQAHYRGMSWMTPVLRDVQGDNSATRHKLKFFDNAATPNLLVSFDMNLEMEKVRAFKELMEDDHVGVNNAYKTLYLGGGADATVIGKDLQQLDFSRTQGKGETRILMAAGVHPTIAGASEGLSGSSLNAGNFTAAKRAFSDIRLQSLWTSAVSSLGTLLPARDQAVELWFDKSEIPFLQDDLKDTAEIQAKRAAAIRQLTDAGYTADSVVRAIQNDDLTQLEHSGLFSVQLQPPNSQSEGADDE